MNIGIQVISNPDDDSVTIKLDEGDQVHWLYLSTEEARILETLLSIEVCLDDHYDEYMTRHPEET
jgi:hypothetical protein